VKATNDNPNDNLIRRTREVWQPRLGRDLSRSEAKQMGTSKNLANWRVI
jgi:hypothetical protein